MTVVELGALGEFVGAFAMVATLIYLAVQIRQNTQTVQAAAVDASVGRINEVRKSLYEDAELSRIYLEGNAEPDALDDECRVRYRTFIHSVLWAAWNVYAQTTLTGMGPTMWAAHIPLLKRVLSCPGGRWFWREYRDEFEESFRTEIDRISNEEQDHASSG